MTYYGALAGKGEFVLDAGWCSTANQPSGCTPVSGVCKPTTAGTLSQFRSMQQQCNRLLVARGKSPIDVDGRIGPRTLSAVNGFESVTGKSYGSCDGAARDAGLLTSMFMNAANRENAPAKVPDPPPTSPPTIASGAGVQNPPDDIINRTKGGGLLGMVSDLGAKIGLDPTTSKMAIGGGALLAGIYLFTRLRKRGGSSSTSIAIAPTPNPRRRRRRRRSRRGRR